VKHTFKKKKKVWVFLARYKEEKNAHPKKKAGYQR